MYWELVEIDDKASEVDSYKTLKVYTTIDGDNFIDAIKEINELNLNRNLVTMIFDNKGDFTDKLTPEYLGKILSDALTASGFDKEKIRKYYLNLDRLILNYLSSIRTFLDHTEAYFKRKYGDNSEQSKSFKKMTQYLYDNYFEYRFIYKLRNYCQHVDMPVEYSFMVSNDDNEIKCELKIEFNPISLLKNFDGWGAVVKKDLEQKAGSFNCLPIIYSVSDNILQLFKVIDYLRANEIRRATQLIKKETTCFRKPNIDMCLIRKYPMDEESGKRQVEMLQIPFYIIDDLKV